MVMRIAEQRKAAGLSQQQLADRMGVAQSNVVGWEKEIYLPRSYQLPLLRDVLGLRCIDELYALEDEDPSMDQYTA